MKFLSKEKISNRRYKTPEGYLVCLDAIIARTGSQDYTKAEIFRDSDDDTIVKLYRPEKEVFSPQTMASFENKPFVDEHPEEDVNVDNHRDYAIGFVRDVRRATVDGEDVLIANLVVTDAEAIAEIESGEKVELSCGYDCDILGEEPNLYQANIRGNHVALCKAGRAGIARIQDSKIKDSFAYIVFKSFDSDKNYEKYKFANDYNIKQAANKFNVKADVSVTRSGWNNQFSNIKMDVTGDKNQIEKLINYCITKLNLEIDKKQVRDSQVEDSKYFVVYGEESGYMKEFKTLPEAKKFIKETQRFDKQEGIEDKYYIEVEIHDSIKDDFKQDLEKIIKEYDYIIFDNYKGVFTLRPSKDMYDYYSQAKLTKKLRQLGYNVGAEHAPHQAIIHVIKDSVKDSVGSYTTAEIKEAARKLHAQKPYLSIQECYEKVKENIKNGGYLLDSVEDDNYTIKPNYKGSNSWGIYKNGKYIENEDSEEEALARIEELKKEENKIKTYTIFYENSIRESSQIQIKSKTKEEAVKEAKRKLGREFVRTVDIVEDSLEEEMKNKNEEIVDNENIELEDKLIEPEESYINEFKRDIQKMGFKIVKQGKTFSGRIHFQILSNEGDKDNSDLKYYAGQLDRIEDKFDRYNIPMTYNIGLQYDGYISAGIDLDKQWVEDSIKDSYVEEWWGQTEEDPRVFAKKYGLTITALKRNRDEVLYRFSGPSKNIEKAMNNGYFYNYEKYVKDSIKDEKIIIRRASEHKHDGFKGYYGYATVYHPVLGNFTVSEYMGKPMEVRTDGYPWDFLQKNNLNPAQKKWIENNKNVFKKKGGEIIIDDSVEDSIKDGNEAKIKELEKDIAKVEKDLQEHIQNKENTSGWMKRKVFLESTIARYKKQLSQLQDSCKDVDTYKEVTQELEKETKKLDSAKVLKLINIAKTAGKVKDSKVKDVDPRILPAIEKLILEAIDLDKQRDKVIIQMKKTPDVFGVDENGKFIDKNKFVNNGMVKAIIKKYQDILTRWNRIMETNNFLKNEMFRVRRIEEGLDAWYLQGLPNQTTLRNLNNLKKNYQDSKVKDGNLDFIIYSNPKGVSEEREDEVVAILKKYGSVKHTMISGMDKFTLNNDVNTLNKAFKELADKKLIAKLSNGAGFVVKADIRDSLDKTYKPGQKVKISNGFNLERETVTVKKDTGAYILTEDGRKINKSAIVDSCKDDMELSAKTSEELDNLMKQYQKKHPTWKFGEIKKDKGLYRCSVIKN